MPDSGHAGGGERGTDSCEDTQERDNEWIAFGAAAWRYALLKRQLPPNVGCARIPPEPSSTESLYTFAMASRFGSAMMWLLLFALPLQGYAAATMLNCGPNHHRMMAAAISEPDQTHEHTAAGHHHHEMGMAAGEHEVASANRSGDVPSLPHLDKLVKFKCNACAVCCTGAAMPTAAFTFEPVPPAMAPESFVPTSHVDFVTDGPDRPPRLSHL